jgi:nicotinamide-nucleotide amidase
LDKEVYSLYESMLNELMALNLTLSVAESCTGGLISHQITEISGASGCFKLGAVTYSNEAKIGILGVRESTLIESGAVSEQVAMEMAEGVAAKGDSSYGIGVTGIAGPGGGSPEKPVGLVYIGFFRSDTGTSHVERFNFQGVRTEIKEQAASSAISSFISFLTSTQ